MVQFDMDNESVERLDKLRQDTHITSRRYDNDALEPFISRK